MSCTCENHTHRNLPGNPNLCSVLRKNCDPNFDPEAHYANNPRASIADMFCPCQQNPHHTATIRTTTSGRFVILCAGCKQDLYVAPGNCTGVELGAFREIFEEHQREASI
jgi:hypothetical protein